LQGMADWPRGFSLSPRRRHVRASGRAGSKDRAEPGRGSGAGGVLDAGARAPIIDACGERGTPAAGSRGMRLSSPHGRSSGRAGRWLHSSLRLSPACAAGGHGAGSRQGPGGANQTGVRAAGPGGAGRRSRRGTECSAASRPVAGDRIAGGRAPSRRAVMPLAGPGGGCARRACRRRPG